MYAGAYPSYTGGSTASYMGGNPPVYTPSSAPSTKPTPNYTHSSSHIKLQHVISRKDYCCNNNVFFF